MGFTWMVLLGSELVTKLTEDKNFKSEKSLMTNKHPAFNKADVLCLKKPLQATARKITVSAKRNWLLGMGTFCLQM